MPNLNQVNLIGHITRDPELRYTPKGTAVATLSLAVNRQWNDAKGQKVEEATFVEIICWQRLAEVAKEYLHKGSPVFFSGRLKQEHWLDKASDKKRSKIVVVAEIMQLLSSKKADPDAKTPPAAPVTGTAAPDDEEVPF